MNRQFISSLLIVLGLANSAISEEKVSASLVADASAIQPGKPFYIGLKFEVPKGYYTYYKSAGSIGKAPTIKIVAPPGFDVGPHEYPGPEVKYQELGAKLAANYVYKRTTVVMARVTPPASLTPGQNVSFSASAMYQYCKEDGSCFIENAKGLELSLPLVAASDSPAPSADASLFSSAKRQLPIPGDKSKYARVWAELSVPELRPGEKADLVVTVDVEDGFKLQTNRPSIPGLISTDLILDDVPGLKKFPVPNYPSAELKNVSKPGADAPKGYVGKVVIKVPVETKDQIPGADIVVTGLLRYQACTFGTGEETCYPPIYASFVARAAVKPAVAKATATGAPEAKSGGGSSIMATMPPATVAGDPTSIDSIVKNLRPVDVEVDGITGGFFHYLLYAFLGGMILNVMPCVLPVIAIKVLSFVQQAGESRSRIFFLNVAYSLGVISVFLILATLAVVAGVGWGGLFQRPEFNLLMAGVVFSMGLSLLGVFEIAVPGFVGSAGGGAHREGPLAAFFTGVLATLLATPCSGPFLSVALIWSVKQPPLITYAIWAMMGFGMSFPYLIFGLFPALVRLLPKPGNWMVAFKEFAGLVLMGTVVYMIWFMDDVYTIPVLVMLCGLALGFWMIGTLYDFNSPAPKKNLVRFTAVLFGGGIAVFSLTTLKDWAEAKYERRLELRIAKRLQQMNSTVKVADKKVAEDELPWEPFSEERLAALLAEGKTVVVDFTADWCLTCKTNEAVAMNTRETRRLVDQLGVVTLYADYTHVSPDIEKWLRRFNSISVPLTVIFPGSKPNEPIVLRDLISQSRMLESLKAAGPSVDPAKRVAISTK